MEIPQSHLENNVDLPASETITNSFDAFRFYIKGMIIKEENGEEAANLFQKAIDIDETFAMAYFMLQDAYVMNNQGDKRLEPIKKIIEYDYKLPERMKFVPKVMYYWETKQPDKNLKTCEMQLKLYPDNLVVYDVLRELYSMKGEWKKLIDTYDILLSQYRGGKLKENKDIAYYLIKIAQIYLFRFNDYENARVYIDKYIDYYKEDSEPYEMLAKIYEYEGNNSKAIEMYQTALTFNHENIWIMAQIEMIKEDEGIQRIQNLENLLIQCKSKDDTVDVYERIATLNRHYGKYDENNKYIELSLELREQYQPFMRYFHLNYNIFTYLAQNGKYDIGYKKLQEFDKTLQSPFSFFSIANQLDFYMAAEKWDILEEMLPRVKAVYKEWGFVDDDAMISEAYIAEYKYQEFDKAMSLYNQALLDNPGYRLSDLHINVGRCYRLLNNHKEAIDKLTQVINSSLYYKVDANYELALIYKEKGNIKKAINHIDIMLDHYKHADSTLIKVYRAKTLRKELSKQL
tara:strand:- start:399 stop:1946 length:1548 start_codon:yes stop_codon:yes gene_type:complete